MMHKHTDVMAPVIVCPTSIEAETAKDESVGHVQWRVPAAVDNSGFQPTVTVIPALMPPVMLPIGNNTITYTAEDANRNKARCTFTITVRGSSTRPLHVKRERFEKMFCKCLCFISRPYFSNGRAVVMVIIRLSATDVLSLNGAN